MASADWLNVAATPVPVTTVNAIAPPTANSVSLLTTSLPDR